MTASLSPSLELELGSRLAGAIAAEELQAAHRCRPGCGGCEAEQAAAALPPPSAFGRFVSSPAALTIGQLVADYGQPFPRLAADDLTQLLIVDATMTRFTLERAAAQERAEREAHAKQKAKAFAEGRL